MRWATCHSQAMKCLSVDTEEKMLFIDMSESVKENAHSSPICITEKSKHICSEPGSGVRVEAETQASRENLVI